MIVVARGEMVEQIFKEGTVEVSRDLNCLHEGRQMMFHICSLMVQESY